MGKQNWIHIWAAILKLKLLLFVFFFIIAWVYDFYIHEFFYLSPFLKISIFNMQRYKNAWTYNTFVH